MRRLLIPVDGSDNAARSLDYAAGLARSVRPLTIHLLHVMEDVSFGDRSHAFHSNEELELPALSRAEQIVKAAADRLASAGAEPVTEIMTGDITRTITERAEQLGCDGIVMGMRGTNLLAEMLMGSTVLSVLKRTKVPVTLVK